MDFSHKVRFFAGIEPAHFPAVGTAIDACAAAIFTFFYILYFVCQMAMESSLMLFDFSKWMQQKREPQLTLQLPCPIKHTLIIVRKGLKG